MFLQGSQNIFFNRKYLLIGYKKQHQIRQTFRLGVSVVSEPWKAIIGTQNSSLLKNVKDFEKMDYEAA